MKMESVEKMREKELAPFVRKTYEMVEDEGTDEMISWGESGTTFVVWCPAEFARDLLPHYFKHNNFSSFVRQLNTYGFRKIAPDRWEFANDFFRKGHKDLLPLIHRRKPVQSSSTVQNSPPIKSNGASLSSGDDQLSSSTSSSDNPPTKATQLSNLFDENNRLRRDNAVLTEELSKAKEKCQGLLLLISKYVKISPQRISEIMESGEEILRMERLMGLFECEEQEEEEEEKENLKLFGVWLKKSDKRKRENDEGVGRPLKEVRLGIVSHG